MEENRPSFQLLNEEDPLGCGMFCFLLILMVCFCWLWQEFGAAVFVASISDSISWIGKTFGIRTLQLATASLITSAGVGAHRFKMRNPKWYGRCEVLFGIAFAVSVSLRLKPGEALLSQWTALIGCAYIIARGLGNIASRKA